MIEAKPILLIRINLPYPTTNDMWSNNGNRYEGNTTFQESMQEKFNDYHVLCFNGYREGERLPAIELKVFNDKDISDTNFEELKNIIKGELNATTRSRESN